MMNMLRFGLEVTPYASAMKLGTAGYLGYVIALSPSGPHRLAGVGVSRHSSWVPAIGNAHEAYYICSSYRGDA